VNTAGPILQGLRLLSIDFLPGLENIPILNVSLRRKATSFPAALCGMLHVRDAVVRSHPWLCLKEGLLGYVGSVDSKVGLLPDGGVVRRVFATPGGYNLLSSLMRLSNRFGIPTFTIETKRLERRVPIPNICINYDPAVIQSRFASEAGISRRNKAMKFILIGGGNLGVAFVKSPPQTFVNLCSFRLEVRLNFLEDVPRDMEAYLCSRPFPIHRAIDSE